MRGGPSSQEVGDRAETPWKPHYGSHGWGSQPEASGRRSYSGAETCPPAPTMGPGRGRGRGTGCAARIVTAARSVLVRRRFSTANRRFPVPPPSFSSPRRPSRRWWRLLRLAVGRVGFVGVRGTVGASRERRRRPGIRVGGQVLAGGLSKARWAGFRSRTGPREGNRHLEVALLLVSAGPSHLRRPWGESVSFGDDSV